MSTKHSWSVVIPAFNEEREIGACLTSLRAYLEHRGLLWEILVVDDGSRDATAAVVQDLAAGDPRIRLIRAPHGGKGAAVRRGMMEARGDWRFMADADLSMPPDNLDRFFAVVDGMPTPDIVIGSREAAGARRVGEPWRRHAIGRLFNSVVRVLLLPGIRDTQCGYKLFSAASAGTLFPRLTTAGFAFDVELLLLARRAGFTIRDVGIVWNCRADSRVALSRGAAAFAEILRIRWNAWLGRYDDIRGVHRVPAA